jgi:uncharacterized protein (UPF0333 family)
MIKHLKISIIVLVIASLMAVSFFYLMNSNKNVLSESEAISILKAAHPEYKNYPNDNLPPQSIQTKQASNGWYVAFVQEGSGRPILEAKCFLVKDDKSVTVIGEYVPKVGEDRFDLSGENIFKLWIK